MSKVSDNYSMMASSLGMSYDSVNKVIYGQKDGYDLIIYAADSNYPYVLSLHTAARNPMGGVLSKDDFKELSRSTKALGMGKQDGNNIIVSLGSSMRPDKLRDNLPEGVNSLLSFLRSKGYAPCCGICGQEVEVSAYKAGGSYFHLCQNCETNMRGNMAVAVQQKEQKKENVVGGVVGALLGSLLGVLSIVLVSQLGYYASVCGVIMAICVLKGYELLGGKLAKKGIIISSVIMLLMVYLGDRLDWAIRLLREGGVADWGYNLFDCYRMIPWAIDRMEVYYGNLALLYVFLLLGAVPTIISKAKEQRETGRMVKIGSSAGYGSYTN